MTSGVRAVAAAAVYIACPSARVERARAMATLLERETRLEVAENGERVQVPIFTIASRWHRGEGPMTPDRDLPLDLLEELADANEHDLLRADLLVALTEDERGLSVGRETYTEIGMARILGKPIVWSTERGGECLSIATRHVETVRRDADVATVLRSILRRGVQRAPRQTSIPSIAAAE